MSLTNVLGLPESIVRAVTNDPYSHGRAQISATSLYGPPKPRLLRRLFPEQIQEDVADRLWALVGQIGHGILERAIYTRNAHEVIEGIRKILDEAGVAPTRQLSLIRDLVEVYFAERASGDMVEERLYWTYDGWVVSGQIDVHLSGELRKIQDFKFTSTYTLMNGGRAEWEKQLNTYADLRRKNGERVDGLEIIAILRDWRKAEARKDPSYPQRQVVVLPVELWSPEKADQWIIHRVRVHRDAELFPAQESICTDEERWIKDTTWAVMKEGQKNAVRGGAGLLSRTEAFTFIDQKKSEDKGEGLYVQERTGFPTRCADYCNASAICEQWQQDPRSFPRVFNQER